jgi:sugar phosphate isomerase/epimerase
MKKLTRRNFVHTAALLAAAISCSPGKEKPAAAPRDKGVSSLEDMPLGIIIAIKDPDKDMSRVRDLGFSTCQLEVSDYSVKTAQEVRTALDKYEIKPTCLIVSGPGEYKWDFYQGPLTIGLVPREQRAERVARLKEGIDFCKTAGIMSVLSHFGFIPENPNDVLYGEFISTMKEQVAGYAAELGIEILFETGQETPVTLLRAIEDIGTGNLGINYDTANLILYGKANPLDGLDVVGKYVKSLHAKDGFYPTNPRKLGHEVPIGQGKVDFPKIIRRLKEMNFKGHITIEREISGPQQVEDILQSKKYLEELIKTV